MLMTKNNIYFQNNIESYWIETPILASKIEFKILLLELNNTSHHTDFETKASNTMEGRRFSYPKKIIEFIEID